MNNQPLVSVITVTYNSEKYVRDAIESILCSSYENFELIIADDNSKDKTWEIILEYKDPRIRAYRNEKNLGEYPNRNKAIDLATGEYLLFIDGDDMIYPHGLDFMVKMLHAFPECAMALMRWFQNNLIYPVVITPRQFYQGEFLAEIGFNNTAFTYVLFNSQILKENGGLSYKYKAGDSFIKLKIAAKHKSLLIGDGLTWWRETPGQASALLNASIGGYLEHISLKLEFLNSENCPLVPDEIAIAKRNLQISLVKFTIRKIAKFEFKDSIKIIQQTKLRVLDFALFFSKQTLIDPFKKYSPDNPMKTNWEKNPYSNNFLKI